MTVEQVLTLVDKGFTRDDIMQLIGDGSITSTVPDTDSGTAFYPASADGSRTQEMREVGRKLS